MIIIRRARRSIRVRSVLPRRAAVLLLTRAVVLRRCVREALAACRFWESETPYLAQVLVADLAVVQTVTHLEEDLAGELGVGAALVGGTYALDFEDVGEILEAGFLFEFGEEVEGRIVDGGELSAGEFLDSLFHEVLDVVDGGEELPHEHLELHLVVGQRSANHEFCEVSKIVAPVEGYPSDVFVAHQAGADEKRAEIEGIDPVAF